MLNFSACSLAEKGKRRTKEKERESGKGQQLIKENTKRLSTAIQNHNLYTSPPEGDGGEDSLSYSPGLVDLSSVKQL